MSMPYKKTVADVKKALGEKAVQTKAVSSNSPGVKMKKALAKIEKITAA